MKIHFFDVEELKTVPLLVFSNQLEHACGRMFGNIYFVVNDRKFRVAFDCKRNCFYEANFYYYGSRRSFNKRCSDSFGDLIVNVYELLTA